MPHEVSEPTPDSAPDTATAVLYVPQFDGGSEGQSLQPEFSAARPLADDQLVVLHEIAKALAQDRGVRSTFALIADKARFLTSSSSAALCLLDEDREVLDFAAVAGRGGADMTGQRVRVADALPGQTALSGEPLLAYNPADPSAGYSGKSRPGPGPLVPASAIPFDERFVMSGGVRSAAVVPIVIGSSSIGSLAAINRLDGQSFTGSDLLMLQILASSASTAIQKDYLQRQAAQRERERNILFRVARNTAASLDVQKILDGTLSELPGTMDLYAAMVFLLNDERTHLYIAAEYGLSDEEREIQLLPDGRLASDALAGGVFIIDDPETDPRYEDLLPSGHAPARSIMVVPLAVRESPAGIVVVMSRQRYAYTRDDLKLLGAVSAQTAVAVENAWIYEDATRRAQEATAIYELSQAVNTNLNLQRVLSYVADSILALLQVDKFALFLQNPQKQALEIKVARNISRDTVRAMCPTNDRRGIAWWVYHYETPAAVQDVAADHRNRSYPIDQEGVVSLLSVPLQAGGGVIGVIHAMSSRRRAFTIAEMELLYTVANQVGVAISNLLVLEETRTTSAALRRSVRRVVKALGSSADASQTAQTIVELAAEMMRTERAVLYSASPGKTPGDQVPLAVRAAHGMRLPATALGGGSPAPSMAPIAGKETPAGRVARQGRPLSIEAPTNDSRFTPAILLSPYVARTGFYLGVTLKIGRDVVGVLEVYGREPRTLQAGEMRQLLTLASQSAVALQNAVLVEEAAKRKEEQDSVAGMAAMLHSAPAINTALLARCLRLVAEALKAEACLLTPGTGRKLGTRRKGLLVTLGAENDSEPGDDPALRDALRGFIGMQREKGLDEAVAWPSGDSGWPSNSKIETCPVAVCPVIGRGASHGGGLSEDAAICVKRRPGQPAFGSGDLGLLQTLAHLLALAC